ncbi:MAG: hypothetical protein ACUVRL_11010 [Candidatus Saccharicenans sp.]|uniref:hypothetical protein n=1 Tax=Candidatus Saccharicenans sp. TaxID=2819258 RepID=UPI004049CF63
MSTVFVIKIIGLFLGVVARSLIPWLRKLRAGQVHGFDRRYFYSALATFILGIILTLVLFPQFKGEAGSTSSGFEDCFRLFCLAFGFGFGWNAIVLEAGQWASWFLTDDDRKSAEDQDI